MFTNKGILYDARMEDNARLYGNEEGYCEGVRNKTKIVLKKSSLSEEIHYSNSLYL